MNATHTVAGSAQCADTEALELDEDENAIQPGDAASVVPPKYQSHSQASGQQKIYLSASPLNVRRQIERLASRLRDPRFDFLFRPGRWLPSTTGEIDADLDKLMFEWLGDRPVTILDLSGIPSSVLQELIGVLLRVIYDALFWSRNLSEGGRETPLLLVMEEAHTYLSESSMGSAGMAVQRIVKEGRKYGIGAMIVSQRPSEIASSILSQCGTFFAMRMGNSRDRGQVRSTVTDDVESLMNDLPILRTGEAIIVGEAVHLPVRTLIDRPAKDRRPDSVDPLVFMPFDPDEGPEGPGGWNRARETSDYADVLQVWRQQDPTSPRSVREHVDEEEQEWKDSQLIQATFAEVGYDPASATLEVLFRSGAIYQYFDVPEHVYDALIGAASVGRFLNEDIKGAYRYARQ